MTDDSNPAIPAVSTAATISTGRGVAGRKAVGAAVAAVTLAAVTVLSGPGPVGGTATGLEPGSIISSAKFCVVTDRRNPRRYGSSREATTNHHRTSCLLRK